MQVSNDITFEYFISNLKTPIHEQNKENTKTNFIDKIITFVKKIFGKSTENNDKKKPDDNLSVKLNRKKPNFIKSKNRSLKIDEISNFINKSFPKMSQKERKKLEKVIASLSHEASKNPKKFQGDGVRVNRSTKVSYDSKKISPPETVRVRLSDDRSQLQVQVYSKDVLGTGTYKIAKKSTTLVFDFSSDNEVEMKARSTAYVKSKNEYLGSNYPPEGVCNFDEKLIEMVLSGMKQVNNAINPKNIKEDKDIHLKEETSGVHIITGKKGRKRLEWEEPRYLTSDFTEAIEAGEVTVDGKSKTISVSDKLRVVKSSLYTAEKMHENGIVHRDVKGANIFLKDEGQLEGYLGDFDLTQKIGSSHIKSEYPYWDLCSCNGLVLPTADYVGVTATLGAAFLGNDFLTTIQKRYNAASMAGINNENYNYPVKKLQNEITEVIISKAEDTLYSLQEELMEEKSKYSQSIDTLEGVISLCFLNWSDTDELVQEIEDQIINAEDEKAATVLREAVKHIKVLSSLENTLQDVIEADIELYQYLFSSKNKKMLKLLTEGGEGAEKALKKIYVKFPIFKDLRNRITDLETAWTNG